MDQHEDNISTGFIFLLQVFYLYLKLLAPISRNSFSSSFNGAVKLLKHIKRQRHIITENRQLHWYKDK